MSKYDNDFETIRLLKREDDSNRPYRPTADFDIQKLNGGYFNRVFSRLAQRALRSFGLRLMQRFFPVFRLRGIYFVTRYADVETILRHPDIFNVPFGLEMETMTTPPRFALGDDGGIHKDQMALIMNVWKHVCPDRDIRPHVERVTRARLTDAGGEIDAASGLFMPGTADSAFKLFGLSGANPDDFADYMAACSALIFGDYAGTRRIWDQAMIGAGAICAMLDENIDRYVVQATDSPTEGEKAKTVLSGLMDGMADWSGDRPHWSPEARAKVRTMLFGILTGYVPTAALGAGKILDNLRQHQDRFAEGKRLARAVESAEQPGTDADAEAARKDLLDFLLEVGRFDPSLFPGQWRRRSPDANGDNLPNHLRRIPLGATVMVSTAAALHDPRKMRYPHQFKPGQGFEARDGGTVPDLTFGLGIHHCFGEGAAHAMLLGFFQVLLSQPGLSFVPERPVFYGPYPGRIRMRYDVDVGHRQQSMINAMIPLAANCNEGELIRLLKDLQNDTSQNGLKAKFDKSGIIHFASLNALPLGKDTNVDDPATHLFVELNADGSVNSILARLSDLAGDPLDQLLPHIHNPSGTDLVGLIAEHQLHFQTRPWGSIGLNFPGTEDMSVQQIRQEKDLFELVQKEITGNHDVGVIPTKNMKKSTAYRDPLAICLGIRKSLVENTDPKIGKLAELMFRPRERFPAFARHKAVSFRGLFVKYFLQYRFAALTTALLSLLIPLGLLICGSLLLLEAVGLYVSLWVIPVLLTLKLGVLALMWLRKAEHREKPDERYQTHARLSEIQAMEDLPGYAQNHITSVSAMKPGVLRRITLALALYFVAQMKVFWFRPGFVTDFATIHYARWVRPKGTQKLVFQSNYDGSWESYLEDFITKVHKGQTMAWNNAQGFPRTNWFFQDGAKDGDAFKRWVRRQQVVTRFFYSAYPSLTTGMIRANALVRDGLARVASFDEARTWLELFSRTPRKKSGIETSQVQTLLFHGLGRHRVMDARLLRFGDAQRAKEWIECLAEASVNVEDPGVGEEGSIAFGDSYPNYTPSFLGLSAEGLEHLGFPTEDHLGRATLPHAFVEGMAARGRVLGDAGTPADAKGWLWRDRDPDGRAVHAICLSYARTSDEADRHADKLDKTLSDFGIEIAYRERCNMDRRGTQPGDAFGFRDGISQPVMRGTQAFAGKAIPEVDVVGPGEFLLGYPDSRGQAPLNILVPGDVDAACLLPASEQPIDDGIAQFGRKNLGKTRDFGRNGSFLVVRQIRHDEVAFSDFVEKNALKLLEPYRDGGFDVETAQTDQMEYANHLHEDTDGQDPSKKFKPTSPDGVELWARQWIGAKMIGRWNDGSSLTRNPSVSLTVRNRARYHNVVGRRLAERINGIGGGSFDAKQMCMMEKFKERMGEVGGPRFASGTDLDLDHTIWEPNMWKTFLCELEVLESETAPLKLPAELLDPITPDNDFQHGRDDPMGLYCPVGSHIRRTNPRDSFRPDSKVTLEINNRHRLLRRGRTYGGPVSSKAKTQDGNSREGTLFMCFNANIERQFEFVQQTWVDSRFFHDGRHSPDPLVAQKRKGDRFVIPRSADSVALKLYQKDPLNFVQTVAGGYFFFPSRQALIYLSRLTGSC